MKIIICIILFVVSVQSTHYSEDESERSYLEERYDTRDDAAQLNNCIISVYKKKFFGKGSQVYTCKHRQEHYSDLNKARNKCIIRRDDGYFYCRLKSTRNN
ncbi:uncharacterized protein LOC127281603 [Leptopilina boulardi]|uniref:uncharacterized protein LOC127281603 n=1 Tax=Leptopilina boulardi TaxID=63433 RepID=UPI0021F58C0D|nr:uncharacterized protein LOC127281603 [Leptopilina boulardi]